MRDPQMIERYRKNMGIRRATKGIILMRVTDDGEVMITEPSGRMRFMGFLKAISFGWQAMRQGYKVEIEQ